MFSIFVSAGQALRKTVRRVRRQVYINMTIPVYGTCMCMHVYVDVYVYACVCVHVAFCVACITFSYAHVLVAPVVMMFTATACVQVFPCVKDHGVTLAVLQPGQSVVVTTDFIAEGPSADGDPFDEWFGGPGWMDFVGVLDVSVCMRVCEGCYIVAFTVTAACAKSIATATRESLWRDRSARLTSPALRSCRSGSPFRARVLAAFEFVATVVLFLALGSHISRLTAPLFHSLIALDLSRFLVHTAFVSYGILVGWVDACKYVPLLTS